MSLELQFLNLLAGLFFLSFTAEILLDRVLRVSKELGLSDLAVGFLILAVSTSFPELSIAILSGASGLPAVTIGDVFGSNVADIFLVLGLTFLLGKNLVLHKDSTSVLSKAMAAAAVFTIFLYFARLSVATGALALLLFVAFVYYSLKEGVKVPLDGDKANKRQLPLDIAVFLLSLAGLLLAARFVVFSASEFAANAGISTAFIAGTIVAIGTSLPELAVNLAALKKNRANVAVGNIAGSVVANLTLVVGAGSLFYSAVVSLAPYTVLVLFSLIAITALALLLHFKLKPTKTFGAVFLMAYAAFVIISFIYD